MSMRSSGVFLQNTDGSSVEVMIRENTSVHDALLNGNIADKFAREVYKEVFKKDFYIEK